MRTFTDPMVANGDVSHLRIVGRGLAARALSQVAERRDDVVIFASGTGDSSCRDGVEFAREWERLEAVLEHCRLTDRRLVYCSSAGAVYGDMTEARHERTPCRPTTPYGSHKLRCEELIRESGCRCLILRISNLIGPGANARQLLPSLVRQVLSGCVRVYRHATRDLIEHERFAAIVDELLENVSNRDTVVVASGISMPAPDLVSTIQRVLKTNAPVELLDAGSPQRFCVEKLHALAPTSARFAIDEPWSAVHELVPKLAAECQARHATTHHSDDRTRPLPNGRTRSHKDVS